MSNDRTGTQIGVYRLQGSLGSGGMGEVYRARDTRLGREVAIKLLPPAFARDADRVARFEREARVLASLNHPNIGAIHGLEDAGDACALVLELVEGETLGERIGRGLTLADSLAIARQIVDALDGAHERGVVHRDLKPANIKVTPDGVVKVLDFGLAKPATEEDSRLELSNSPTVLAPRSLEGTLLGTAAYMSPEQARGRPVDKRADIWAFGCVLFEMLTGRPPFGGSTTADIVAAIVEREPDWSLLPEPTPEPVRALLKRCLDKSLKRRLRDIGDALPALEGTSSLASSQLPARAPRTGIAAGLPWMIAAAAVVAAVGLSLRTFGSSSSPESPPPRRVSIVAPVGAAFTPLDAVTLAQFNLSPDGNRLAFIAARRSERARLWVQNLETSSTQEIAGTEGALGLFWAPDSQRLAFFARGKLKKVSLDGAAPQDLADVVPDVNGGTWNREGVIVFGGPPGAGLNRVSENGGPVTEAAALDPGRSETGHRWPQFLPDGRRFLFYVRSSVPANSGVYVGSLDDSARRQVLPSLSTAVHANSGHLLFERAGALVAQAFDATTLTLTGAPVPLGDSIRGNPGSAQLPVSISGDALAYWSGQFPQSELLWFDRTGRPLGKLGASTWAASPSLSADGSQLLTSKPEHDPNVMDVWRTDLAGGVTSRLTFSGRGRFGIWSPDARTVAFSTMGQLFELPAGGGQEKVVTGTGNHYAIFPVDWSRDGKWLIYVATGNTGWDVWALDLRTRKSRPIVEAAASQVQADLSPDGRWLAYASDESGVWEVYVRPFPEGAGRWQISTGGGSQPRWRGDGREMYFVDGDGQLTAVALTSQTTFEAGARRALFQTAVGVMLAPFRVNYDVSADGQRFLVNSPVNDPDPTRITIVLNWQARLRPR